MLKTVSKQPLYSELQSVIRSDAPSRTLAIVLAGGRGNRLLNLTDRQAKPAVHFGGRFRIVDFTLSNCVNSGFQRIFVLTQYQADSLGSYLANGWSFLNRADKKFMKICPAQPDAGKSYEGTADAVYKNLSMLERQEAADWVLVLAGDHIYKMDYAAMLAEHIASGADLTIPCIEVDRMTATAFGVMKVDARNNIIDFLEKPADPPGIPGNPDKALASMGIYIFNKKFLCEVLRKDALQQDSGHDFGTDIVPALVASDARVIAHRFADSCVQHATEGEAYWRDVGTVDAYWAANIDLTKTTPGLDLYDADWPIYTGQERLPPARFICDTGPVQTVDSIIANGCVIESAKIKRSLLSNGVHVGTNADIWESVLLPDVHVGRNVLLTRTVVDRGCILPDNLVVGFDPAEDARRFYRSPNGIVLINAEMLSGIH